MMTKRQKGATTKQKDHGNVNCFFLEKVSSMRRGIVDKLFIFIFPLDSLLVWTVALRSLLLSDMLLYVSLWPSSVVQICVVCLCPTLVFLMFSLSSLPSFSLSCTHNTFVMLVSVCCTAGKNDEKKDPKRMKKIKKKNNEKRAVQPEK